MTCAACGASHPVIYEGQECVICGSKIDAPNDRRQSGGIASEERATVGADEFYRAQLFALQSERDGLRAALAAVKRSPHDAVSVSDYEWYVELAAKGLAERDNYPMPKSVATPKAFYEVMASAALDAAGLRALLARVLRAEKDLEIVREALRQADLEAEGGRHRFVSVAVAPDERPETGPEAPPPAVTEATPEPSRPQRRLKRAIRRSSVRRGLR